MKAAGHFSRGGDGGGVVSAAAAAAGVGGTGEIAGARVLDVGSDVFCFGRLLSVFGIPPPRPKRSVCFSPPPCVSYAC